MIITKLQGGLGNQLFQWAVTRNLAVKYSVPYFFDKSYFSSPGGGQVTKWNFELDKFKNLTINENPNRTGLHHVHDNYIHNPHIPNYSYLDGYWQTEKYFIENRELILKDLGLPRIMISGSINDVSTIGLHVRRGDYINIQSYHPLQTIKYYEDAFDLIDIKDATVVVFSNDIGWCKDNLKFDNMCFIEGNSNVKDLQLMANCDHNIIANSSFSWWGAWLNEKQNRVVAPKKWFGPNNNQPIADIYADGWLTI